jgi:hypothetical protein
MVAHTVVVVMVVVMVVVVTGTCIAYAMIAI